MSVHDGASSRHAGFSSRCVITSEESLRAARMSLSEAGYVSLVSMQDSLTERPSRNLTPNYRMPDGTASRYRSDAMSDPTFSGNHFGRRLVHA